MNFYDCGVKQDIQKTSLHSHRFWPDWLSYTYLAGVFILAVLAFYPKLLDYTLLPRYLTASLTILSVLSIILYHNSSNKISIIWPDFDLPTGLLLAYALWGSLSICWALSFSEAIFESSKMFIGLASFYICRLLLLNDPNFKGRLIKIIILLCIPILFVVGMQMITVDYSLAAAHYEIRGISGHKNLFSTVLFLLLGFVGSAYFTSRDKWRLFSLVLVIIILILMIYLRTRSSYLALIFAGLSFGYINLHSRLRPTLAKIITGVIIIMILSSLSCFLYLLNTYQLVPWLHASQIDALWQSDTGYERIILWEKTGCLIRANPFFGVGTGNWQLAFPSCGVHDLYSVELDSTTFQRPHNDWLWVWAENGIIGLCLYLGFFIAVLRKSYVHLKNLSSRPNRMASLIRHVCIIGFMLISFFSFPKERIEILILVFTLMGLLYPTASTQKSKGKFSNLLVICLLLLSMLLNIFIAYKRVKGEQNMKDVLILKQQKNWAPIVAAADRAYSAFYTIDPTSIPIHWYRGTSHFAQGQASVAKQDFLMAEKMAPYNQHVHNDLATCYEVLGEKALAKIHYKQSIAISPLFDDPKLNLSKSFFNEGKYEEALEWVEKIKDEEVKRKYKVAIEQQLMK